MARTLRLALAFAAIGVAIAAFAVWPEVLAWRAERDAERAFTQALQEIDLKLVDKRLSARDGSVTDRIATRWRYDQVHALLRRSAAEGPPQFRTRMRLLLGVYDRSSALLAESERATAESFRIQLTAPYIYEDPVETARALASLAEIRAFVATYHARVEADHEQARREIAVSDLPSTRRAEVWATAEQAYLILAPNAKGAEALAPKLAALARAIEYLDRNRGRYFTYESGTVAFKDYERQREWEALWRDAKR